MALRISDLEGVTAEMAEALKANGLNDSTKLLAAAGQKQDRADLAEKLGIDERALLEVLNRAIYGQLLSINHVAC